MVTRNDLMNTLKIAWPAFIRSYSSFTAEEQAEYLRRQGYPSFSALLAHINAWLARALTLIETYKTDADFVVPAVNVDDFNAAAVALARDLPTAQTLQTFDELRERLIRLVTCLTDFDDFSDPRIVRQLEMEIIAHLEEHDIKKDPLSDKTGLLN